MNNWLKTEFLIIYTVCIMGDFIQVKYGFKLYRLPKNNWGFNSVINGSEIVLSIINRYVR